MLKPRFLPYGAVEIEKWKRVLRTTSGSLFYVSFSFCLLSSFSKCLKCFRMLFLMKMLDFLNNLSFSKKRRLFLKTGMNTFFSQTLTSQSNNIISEHHFNRSTRFLRIMLNTMLYLKQNVFQPLNFA